MPWLRHLTALLLIILSLCVAHRTAFGAQIAIHEPGWTIVRAISTGALPCAGVVYNEVDDGIYYTQTNAGLFRVGRSGDVTTVGPRVNLYRLAVNPSNGDIFVTHPFNGNADCTLNPDGIFRAVVGASGVPNWVCFSDNRPDPLSLAISDGTDSSNLAAGQALATDQGSANNNEDIWLWSANAPGNQVLYYTDTTPGEQPLLDIALTPFGTFVVEDGGDAVPGRIFTVRDTPPIALTLFLTTHTFEDPSSIEWDPRTSTLIVQDRALDLATGVVFNGSAWRVDLSGVATPLLSGVGSVADFSAGQIDVSSGGRRILAKQLNDNVIYELMRCSEPPPGEDCDGDGVWDKCEISQGTDTDCDRNGIIDSCDIAAGASDVNGDFIPDACQSGISLYCFGDGSGTPCPCIASGVQANEGCPNSIIPGVGARLRASGSSTVSSNAGVPFTLVGDQMPNSTVLYFQGTDRQSLGSGAVFGDGLRCVSGTIIRIAAKVNSGGLSWYPQPSDPPISVRGLIPAAGGLRTYQAWYRNAAAFCTPSTFNLTNGLETLWMP